MIIDITDIVSNDNSNKRLTCSIDADDITYNHASYPIIDSKPFELSIVNEGNHTITISCSTSLGVSIPCDRCTEDVVYTFDVDVDKSLRIESEKIVDAEDLPFVSGNDIDVDSLLFDEILICWPAKILCREDCKGLCPECGINLNDKTCDCANKPKDPRMAKIRDVFREFKEV